MSQTRCMRCMKTYDEQYDICPYCGYKRGAEPVNPLHLPEGTVLDNRYLIGTVIGHGGFGITYIAFDQSLERKVAVKEYFPYGLSTRTTESPTVLPFTTQDADNNYRYGREKFIEEARTLARFSNMDSIVSVLTCFMQNNTAYIVMEYLEGEDLLEHVKKRGGKISWEETLTLLSTVMDALTALHARGLIHRDISPDNIFITKDGKTKLLDFGTARFAMGEKSKSLSVILKPGYAPPEQYSSRGKQGPWTDVYALAATIYRCLTGQAPADAVDRQMGTALESPSSLGANIPKIAENVLMGALALEPDKRIQTVGDLKWQLEQQKEVQPKVEQQQPMAPQVHINIDGYNPSGSASSKAADYRDEEYQEAMRRADEEEADIRKRHRNTLIGVGVVVSVIIIALIAMGQPKTPTTGGSFSTGQAEEDATPVDVPDVGLKEGIIKTLEQMGEYVEGDTLTVSDMQKLTELRLASPTRQKSFSGWSDHGYIGISSDIQDITGLEYATNLEYIELPHNHISDISALSGLTSLTDLDLYINSISDISALSGMTNLTSLSLSFNSISDISALSGLTNLTYLNLFSNDISDISALSGLMNLASLNMGDNNISNISALSGLMSLTDLNLFSNDISDISALSGMTNLTILSLSYNDINDIGVLSRLTSLTYLDLYSNRISNISPLEVLISLEYLRINSEFQGSAVLAKLEDSGCEIEFEN